MLTARRALVLFCLITCSQPLSAAEAPQFNYSAAIAEARRAWGADAKELADLLHKLAEAADKAGRTEDTLTAARRDLAKLKREREEALEDVRNGDFCDGCGRTRRDLLAHGEPFPHPDQHRRPARPEDFERVENEFKSRMEIQQRLIVRYEPEFKDARAALDATHHRFLVQLPVYHKHLAEEQAHRLGKWFDEKRTAEIELKTLQETIDRHTAGMKKGIDPDELRLAQAELLQLNQQLKQRVTQARFASERATQEERNFRKDVFASLDSLGRIAEPIPDRYGLSGWFLSKSIRNTPRPVGYTVSAIYVGDPAATPSDLQRLLEGTAPAGGKPDGKSAKEKSVQDLLDGK